MCVCRALKIEFKILFQWIVDEKIEDGVKHFLVRWKGYKVDDDTWEPEHSLNCPEIISKFNEFKKNKRSSGVRGTPKKPSYTEIDETEGEDVKHIYVKTSSKQGSKKGSKSKSKAKPTKGKKSPAKPKTQKAQKARTQIEEEDDDDEDDDYEVEEILGEKMEKGQRYYFLKWKGE